LHFILAPRSNTLMTGGRSQSTWILPSTYPLKWRHGY